MSKQITLDDIITNDEINAQFTNGFLATVVKAFEDAETQLKGIGISLEVIGNALVATKTNSLNMFNLMVERHNNMRILEKLLIRNDMTFQQLIDRLPSLLKPAELAEPVEPSLP